MRALKNKYNFNAAHLKFYFVMVHIWWSEFSRAFATAINLQKGEAAATSARLKSTGRCIKEALEILFLSLASATHTVFLSSAAWEWAQVQRRASKKQSAKWKRNKGVGRTNLRCTLHSFRHHTHTDVLIYGWHLLSFVCHLGRKWLKSTPLYYRVRK